MADYNQVKTMDKAAAKAAGLYQNIGSDIDDPYIAELKSQVIHQDAIDAAQKDIRIVYTPLHGTGNIPARRVAAGGSGFEHVYVVRSRSCRTASSRRSAIRTRRPQRHLRWD